MASNSVPAGTYDVLVGSRTLSSTTVSAVVEDVLWCKVMIMRGLDCLRASRFYGMELA